LAVLGALIAVSFLGFSLKIITSKWSKDLFLRFLATGFTCIVLVVILDPLLKNEPGYTGQFLSYCWKRPGGQIGGTQARKSDT